MGVSNVKCKGCKISCSLPSKSLAYLKTAPVFLVVFEAVDAFILIGFLAPWKA